MLMLLLKIAASWQSLNGGCMLAALAPFTLELLTYYLAYNGPCSAGFAEMTFTCLRLAGWYKQVGHTCAGTPGISACLQQLALQSVSEHENFKPTLDLRALCHTYGSNVLLRFGSLAILFCSLPFQ